MTGIRIPVEAAFDKGDVDAAVSDFQQKFNKLGDTISRLNKVKFSPIDRASVDDLRKVVAATESLRKVSGDFNRRLKATGQDKAGFVDIDWDRLYPDPHARARQMQKAFDYVTGGGRFSSPPSPAPGGAGGRPPAQPPAAPPGGGGAGQQGRRIVSAGLRAAGPVGGVADSALSAGMVGGVGAGLAGLVGGMVAIGIGKIIGSVREKIGAAQQEFIGYDTLKRTLGDVNVSFGVLRESLRASARSLDMTFEEGLRLGTQFAKLSGITSDQYKTLSEEVNVAGGFGRSFGLDPSQSTAFFAQMRMYQVTSDTQRSRELALLIGESVAKSGAFSKVDEVLEAIAGFTAQQTRTGMNRANVEGYAGFYSGMVGSGIPGMDPASAAALLGRVNASIAAGGANGEAGQNFLYSALGTRLGLDPLQTTILREQGAFGTGAGTFGEGSTYARFARKYGLGTPGAAGSGETNLQLIMEQLQRNYAGKPELMVNAMANLFGVNNSQAMALSTIDPKQLGGLAARLKRSGVNINDINATGISRIAQIEADGSLSDDEKTARIKALARENQEETEGSRTRATINGVERAIQDMAGKMVPLMNDMRSGIMYLAGEKGSKSPREIMEAVARAESKDRSQQVLGLMDPAIAEAERRRELLKGKILGVSSKRDDAARWGDDKKRDELNEQLRQLEEEERAAQERITVLKKERADKLEEEKRRIDETIENIRKQAAFDPEAEERAYAGYREMNDHESRRRPRVSGYSSPALPAGQQSALADRAQQYFVNAGWSREQAAGIVANLHSESGMRTGAVGDGGAAFGLAQWHPDRQAAFKRRFGKDIREASFEEQLAFVHHELTAGGERAAGGRLRNARTAGEAAELVTRLYERPANPDRDAADRAALAERLTQRPLESATPLPEAVRPGDAMAGARGGQQTVEVRGTFNLNGQNGQPAAAPVHVATRVGTPVPTGAAP